MTGNHDTDGTDSPTDPDTLADRDGVDFRENTHEVDAAEFESATELDSHVVVGVTDDRGVLLANDGHHGWTLPAFAVDDGADWLAVASREFEVLTGTPVTVDGVERVRRREYRVPDTDDRTVVWNVVVRASPADTATLLADPESREDGTELQWFDGTPDDAPEAVADDVECVLDPNSSANERPTDGQP
ncbi:NUDIX domain-containing protein [Halobacterium wangiae]|uniref:NUDIX domain-containing protein n=1 Tax=Halobacterium wangiae TaxID=2902623 RepID=UPI001E2FDF60|nr:NUDIX domain-containing protein [Halobacterium wangiae]